MSGNGGNGLLEIWKKNPLFINHSDRHFKGVIGHLETFTMIKNPTKIWSNQVFSKKCSNKIHPETKTKAGEC